MTAVAHWSTVTVGPLSRDQVAERALEQLVERLLAAGVGDEDRPVIETAQECLRRYRRSRLAPI